MVELQAGNYEDGWKRYEYRFQCRKERGILLAQPSCKQWRGEELQAGTPLLLVSEQGLGDTLQFMRYAVVLKDRGIAVSLYSPDKLKGLIEASGVSTGTSNLEAGMTVHKRYWSPLLSVPRYLNITPGNPVISDAYIKTETAYLNKWKILLDSEDRPVIGINWQGNPHHEKTNSIGRSLSLETFAPVVEKINASFLSLQKGFGSEQLDTCSFRDHFVSCQPHVNEAWDFLETAAIITNCNLVITSDTSVAHLAGGMGKQTWLLLKKVPEWRWGLEGEKTMWYPSMRIFRQRERGNWDEVMERVALELDKLIKTGNLE